MGWLHVDLAGTRVLLTDRRGGVSKAPFDTLNLSTLEGDDRGRVAANRELVASLLGDPGGVSQWIPLRQVHGADVFVGGDAVPGEPVEADAAVVTRPGPVAVVMTADCAPLALLSPNAAAAVHAGWRGLRAGVVEAAVAALRSVDGEPVHAVLGACIGPCCYEFGERELDAVAAALGPEVRATTRDGSPSLDLRASVRAALGRSGVGAPLIDVGACTSCASGWFSYRRDGRTGRQGLLVTRLSR